MITRQFCFEFSYALGVRNLISAHHWAGYPKKPRKWIETHICIYINNKNNYNNKCLYGQSLKTTTLIIFEGSRLQKLPLPVSWRTECLLWQELLSCELREIPAAAAGITDRRHLYNHTLVGMPSSYRVYCTEVKGYRTDPDRCLVQFRWNREWPLVIPFASLLTFSFSLCVTTQIAECYRSKEDLSHQ